MSTSSATARSIPLDPLEGGGGGGLSRIDGGVGDLAGGFGGSSDTGLPSKPRKSSSSSLVEAGCAGGACCWGFSWLRPNGSSSSMKSIAPAAGGAGGAPLVVSCGELVPTCGEGDGLGTGKWVDASTGAEASKAARISSSSGDCGFCWVVVAPNPLDLPLPPFSKLSQNREFCPPYCDSNRDRFSASFLALSSCSRLCCSTRGTFLLGFDELNETRFAKLSLSEVAGLVGGLDAVDEAERGVERPEGLAGLTLGNKELELMGGGFWGALDELADQLRPLRSSIMGLDSR